MVIETNPELRQPVRLDRFDRQPLRVLDDRFHQDQGRLVPQGQRRIPRPQRPGRPRRDRASGRPSSGRSATRALEIQNYASLFLISTKTIKPEPVKVNVKVVMIGDEEIYNILFFQDEEFKRIFKIKSEFDTEMPKTDDAVRDYVRFIKKISRRRIAPRRSTGRAWPRSSSTGPGWPAATRSCPPGSTTSPTSSGRPITGPGRTGGKPSGRPTSNGPSGSASSGSTWSKTKIQEMIEEGSILIDTAGAVVGQVNGLAVYSMGQFAFGKPSRITARTSVGRAGVINIEREADLSGETHNKGVLILGGYLRGQYRQGQALRPDGLDRLRTELRRRGRRQRLLDRGLRDPLGAFRPAAAAGHRRHRLAQPEGRDPADRRGQRKDRGILRRLQGPGADRHPGRHDPPSRTSGT